VRPFGVIDEGIAVVLVIVIDEIVAVHFKFIDGIEFVYFSHQDVVRHELVQRIIRAYERFDARRADIPPDRREEE